MGTLLVRAVLQRLRESGAAGCVVLGNPAYYARFGFVAEHGAVLPGAPPGYFQALSFGSPLPRGVVACHEAFGGPRRSRPR